jgi:hypothetical protein
LDVLIMTGWQELWLHLIGLRHSHLTMMWIMRVVHGNP